MAGMVISEESIQVLTGGQSQAISVSTTSAQSSEINVASATVYSTVDVFFRQGSNPTALSNGIDQILPAYQILRLSRITPGNKLAFITTTGTGTVYLTKGA